MATHLSDDRLKTTLLNLNFDEAKVTRFIAGCHLAAAQDLLISYVPTSKKGRQGKYQHLCLSESPRNRNWVVFDPCKSIPTVHNDMLRLLVRYAIYKPGNKRYLEYNVSNGSFRLRSVDEAFKGRYISYTTTGPVLLPLGNQSDDVADRGMRSKRAGGGSTAKVSNGSESNSGPPNSSESELTGIDSEG